MRRQTQQSQPPPDRDYKSERKPSLGKKWRNSQKEKSETKSKKTYVVFMLVSDEEAGVSIPYTLWSQSGDSGKKLMKEHGAEWCPVFKIWKAGRVEMEYIRRDLPAILAAEYEDTPEFVKLATIPLSNTLFLNKFTYKRQPFALDQHPLYERLYPFQRQTLEFCSSHFGRILIADEMGVGKSVQSLACCLIYPQSMPVLVICPSALKHVWKDEVGKWLKDRVSANQVIVIKKGVVKEGELKQAKVVIASYEIATKLTKELGSIEMVICDEAHYLKNPDTSRCEKLIPFLKQRKRVFLLTGTPALAKPKELFNLLTILRPDLFPSVDDFGERYCYIRKNPWTHKLEYDGGKNLAELHYLLKKTVMIRRLKVDVLPQLPPKQRQIIYMETENSVVAEIKSLLAQLPADSLRESDKIMDVFVQEGQQTMAITRCFLLSAMAKLHSVKQYISAILENDIKLIIFAHHRVVMDDLEAHIKSHKIHYIRLDGDHSAEVRKKKVDQFQQEYEVRVAILSITALGTGFTLTAASTVIFAELFWTPAMLIQAEDRTHRIGQQQSVNIHYLVGDKTLDPIMLRQLERKIGTVARVLDGEAESLNMEVMGQGQMGKFELQPENKRSKGSKGSKITDYFTPVSSQTQKQVQLPQMQHSQSMPQQQDNPIVSQINQQSSEDSLFLQFVRKKKTSKITMTQ